MQQYLAGALSYTTHYEGNFLSYLGLSINNQSDRLTQLLTHQQPTTTTERQEGWQVTSRHYWGGQTTSNRDEAK